MKKLARVFARNFMDWFLKLRKTVFFRAVQRTLILLSPLAIIGSFFSFLKYSVFTEGSLLYSLLQLDNWLPEHAWRFGMYLSTGMTYVTLGMFGIYAAYLMSLYTARLVGRDSKTAGLTAIVALLFMSYIYNPRLDSTFALSLIFAIMIGSVFYFAQVRLLSSTNFRSIVARIQSTNNPWFSIPWTMLISFLDWGGIGSPLDSLGNIVNSGAQAANMNAALTAGSSWNIPYKCLGSSLLQSYGMMGCAGTALALMIVIFLYSKDHSDLRLAKLNLVQVLFNSGVGFFTGLPVALNPIYALPFTIVPGINMLLATGAIALHIVPPSGYLMLQGTPGLLNSFVATNGSVAALLFSLALLILDVLIWIPFYKLSVAIEEKVVAEDTEAEEHAVKA